MDQRSLRVLEYYKIISLLEEYALSDMGKEIIKNMEPSRDAAWISSRLDEVSQASFLLTYRTNQLMDIFPDIRGVLHKAKIGSILSPHDLLRVCSVLRLSGKIKKEVNDYPNPENISRIFKIVSRLKLYKDLMDKITRCVESEERISSYASPRLANIRRRISSANERIRDRLNNLIRSPQFQKYLQDPIITIRNGRYVVPVKQEHRGNIPGMIHDQSSSGATVFIEPMSVVEANNEIKELTLEEDKEVERILLELTGEIRPLADSILDNLDILARLDVIFAKANFSSSYNGIHPELGHKPMIKIINGRHPLIPRDKVVPITVDLNDETKGLIITGPNTGGKTVTLKTVGLFVLMVQTGMHIPANHGSIIGIFNGVFADIGDEQSIEQSLSTFSSHMVQIANITKDADHSSLVLLDELGAGTDPIEGAALAMSILKYLYEKGSLTIATTHYSELKVFALTQEGMENASMEFDVETLRPTFHLLMGIPGKSNAFEISKRLGLQEELIDSAKKLLSQEEIHFEDILSDMETDRIAMKNDREKARLHLEKIKHIRESLAKEKERNQEKKDEILKKAYHEAKEILGEAKKEADDILKNMRKIAAQGYSSQIISDAEDARNLLKKSLDTMDQGLGGIEKPMVRPLSPPKDLRPGESVHVASLDQTGQVLAISDDKEEVQVQIGIMKINVHISNLKRIKEKGKGGTQRSQSNVSMADKKASMELDLRGQDLEGALVNVDKYLDNVFLMGLKEVLLIHGKGTGILRKGIHKYLRHHPHVDSYRLGRFGEGESGVTVVTLK